MFGWLRPPRYQFDGETVTGRGTWLRSVSMNLSEIVDAGIETTDTGPFDCDVFLVLNRGPNGISIPSVSPVFKVVLDALGQFDGFDWVPFIEAMGCTERQYFRCWTREPSDVAGA